MDDGLRRGQPADAPAPRAAASPEGLVLEVVARGLSRWMRTADGGWVGVVTWVGRTAAGESIKAAEQLVTADALRPR